MSMTKCVANPCHNIIDHSKINGGKGWQIFVLPLTNDDGEKVAEQALFLCPRCSAMDWGRNFLRSLHNAAKEQ